MLERKRFASLFMVACGLSLHCVAITTEYWWQKAVPVRSPAEINKSVVYFWKGLHEACAKTPNSPSGPICKKLATAGLENGEWFKEMFYINCCHSIRFWLKFIFANIIKELFF